MKLRLACALAPLAMLVPAMLVPAMLVPALLGLVLAEPTRAAEERTLRIGTEAGYPPMEYRDPAGTLKGLEVDFGNALCARMGAKCVWVPISFDGLIMSLQAAKIDMIIASMSITEERAKAVDFTHPYYASPAQLIALRNSGITDDPATWKGKAIGVQSGTNHQTYAEQRLKNVDDKAYDSLEEAYLDLASGRVDAVLADKVALYDWMQKIGQAKGYDFVGKPIEDPILKGNIAIALRKDDGDLKSRLNAAIDAMLSDGEFDRMSARYFPFSIRPN